MRLVIWLSIWAAIELWLYLAAPIFAVLFAAMVVLVILMRLSPHFAVFVLGLFFGLRQ